MKRLNDATFFMPPYAWLLTCVFCCTVLSFSHRVIDFNHTKDLLLCLGLILSGGVCCFITPTVPGSIPRMMIVGMFALLIAFGYHLSPISPGIANHTIRMGIHYSLALSFLYIYSRVVPIARRQSLCCTLLIVSAVLVSILAWMQYAGWLPTLFPVFPHYPQAMYSVFGNQNLLGGYLAIAIPIVLFQLIYSDTFKKSTTLILLLLIATCLISGSRSGWLAAIIGCLCILPYRSINASHWQLLPMVIVVIVGVFLFSPETTIDRITQSLSMEDIGFQVRRWIWIGAWELVLDYPLLGVGPGNFQYFSPEYMGLALTSDLDKTLYSNQIHTLYTHSTPLDLLVDFGMIGAAICVAWVYALIRYRASAVWGGAVAFSVYAFVNSVGPNTAHVIAGLLLFMTLKEGAEPSNKVAGTRQSNLYRGVPLVIVTLLSIGYISWIYIPSQQWAAARSAYIKQEEQTSIIVAYKKAVSTPHVYPQVLAEFGYLTQHGDPEGALVHMQQAAEELDTGEIHFALSQAYLDLDRPEKAAFHAEMGVMRWPYYAPGWVLWERSVPEALRPSITQQAQSWIPKEELPPLPN